MLHAHILLIVQKGVYLFTNRLYYIFNIFGMLHIYHLTYTYHLDNMSRNADQIDKLVSAELPDRLQNRRAYATVVEHMIHGPCGSANPAAPCTRECDCVLRSSKHFPKDF